MSTKFIHIIVCIGSLFFLLLSVAPFYKYSTICLFILTLKNIWVVSVRAIINKVAINFLIKSLCRYFFLGWIQKKGVVEFTHFIHEHLFWLISWQSGSHLNAFCWKVWLAVCFLRNGAFLGNVYKMSLFFYVQMESIFSLIYY